MRDIAPSAAGCCQAGLAAAAAAERLPEVPRGISQPAAEGTERLDLMVPEIRCAACMNAIETGLGKLQGVASARVNLSHRRVRVLHDPAEADAAAVIARLGALGYEARPFDAAAMAEIERDTVGRDLLARLGVAGFAAMNVMLLSVAVWSGAEAATRDLLHWVSALIALPAIAFAGQPFFRSAVRALWARTLNMDVPISLAVILAVGVSLWETAASREHAYFDAGITLVFFLLIGRYLDHRTRAVARGAAAELTALAARSASVVGPDGTRRAVAIEDLALGDIVAIAPGERVPADGVVVTGSSDLDRSMVTGESVPEPAAPGAEVHAGMMNLSGPLELRVTATGDATLLAEIARMVEAAEQGKTRHDRWADAAARHYAWSVHAMAALAFGGWLVATGDIYRAVMVSAAVLIITCPCALGLAVPAVHAVASGRLFRRGIFLKDGTVLERLAEADMVVFDKTGTLTRGAPSLVDAPEDAATWAAAAALARGSSHPLARALAEAAEARGVVPAAAEDLREVPGAGVDGRIGGRRVRLGRAGWARDAAPGEATGVWLAIEGAAPAAFRFEDRLREDAADTIAALKSRGFGVALFSGDAAGPVRAAATAAGIDDARPAMTPADKLRALEELARSGRKVLMVGDGINDAPALAAAHASMSPVSAADVSRASAGLVFTGMQLAPVVTAVDVARAARARARENFALAALYNFVAVPVALAGMVTPLIAALSMSGSSIVVTLNALRMRGAGRS